jgi:hypothetical protein
MAIAVCSIGIPAKPAIESRTTDVLGTPGSTDYETARDIVNQATSLAAAVQDQDFFLGPMSQEDRDEIVDMLARIPAGVAQGVLGELRNAFGGNARIVFVWNPHPEGGFDYSSWRGDDGVAHLELRTPPGPPRP